MRDVVADAANSFEQLGSNYANGFSITSQRRAMPEAERDATLEGPLRCIFRLQR